MMRTLFSLRKKQTSKGKHRKEEVEEVKDRYLPSTAHNELFEYEEPFDAEPAEMNK